MDHKAGQIAEAVKQQIDHGRYDTDPIYGTGQAGVAIADILSRCEILIQKRITF